jgi:hypothetical protein
MTANLHSTSLGCKEYPYRNGCQFDKECRRTAIILWIDFDEIITS